MMEAAVVAAVVVAALAVVVAATGAVTVKSAEAKSSIPSNCRTKSLASIAAFVGGEVKRTFQISSELDELATPPKITIVIPSGIRTHW